MIYIFGVLLSMLIIWRACDGFESASGYLGRNMSDGVRGATFNAIGSSIPELMTTAIALLIYADNEGFSFGIGTTAGSAIFNSAIIPSLIIVTVLSISVVAKITISRKVIIRDGLFLIASNWLLIKVLAGQSIGVYHGLILMSFYFIYVGYMLSTMKRDKPFDGGDGYTRRRDTDSFFYNVITIDLRAVLLQSKDLTTKRAWLLLLLSTAVIGGACHLLVESCYGIGEYFHINNYFIAVILAAAATSVPDTVLSIKDAMENKYDDALANALGSNIFDICFCLGLPLFLYCLFTGNEIFIGLANEGHVAELRVLLLLSTITIFAIFLIGKTMGVIKAILMFSVYVCFVTFIISRAYGNPVAKNIGLWLQDVLALIC
ncbi:MAG: sodium:calcium antiporter [Alphaproteobacteria bacterium]